MHGGQKMLSCLVASNSAQPHGLYPARPLCPREFPGKNIGVVAISFSNVNMQFFKGGNIYIC